MEIFNEIKSSIVSREYYKDLLSKPFSYSRNYFIKFALVMAVCGMLSFSFPFISGFDSSLDFVKSEISNNYPGNLEITLKNGEISSNVEEPFTITISEIFGASIGEEALKKSDIKNLLVVDTKNELSFERVVIAKTLLYLSKTNLAFYDINNGKVEINSLRSFPDYVLNKNSLLSLVGKFRQYRIGIFVAIGALSYLMSLLGTLFFLVYLVFGALLILGVAKIKKINIDYKKSYQIGMHLMTPAIIISFFISSPFPFMFTAIVVLVASINLTVTDGNI